MAERGSVLFAPGKVESKDQLVDVFVKVRGFISGGRPRVMSAFESRRQARGSIYT